MARFHSRVQGSHGRSTQQGTGTSGIFGHLYGKKIGIEVSAFVSNAGEDIFIVTLTSGLSDDIGPVLVGTYTREDLEAILARGD